MSHNQCVETTMSGSASVYEHAYRVPTEGARIFAALTDHAILRQWFAEHAEIGVPLRAGSRFAFWGRFTPFAPERGDALQVVIAVESASKLVIDWPWHGTATRAALSIEAGNGAGSVVRVRHEIEPPYLGFLHNEAQWYAHDFWRLSMGNLRTWLRTGKAALRPDFAAPAGQVDLSIEIEAPIETVWRCLTDPAKMDLWLSKAATVQLRDGGVYDYGWGEMQCSSGTGPCGPTRVVRAVPPRLLVTNWQHPGQSESEVHWMLEPTGTGTRVTLKHAVPKDRKTHTGYIGGWSGFMAALRETAEGTGEADRFEG